MRLKLVIMIISAALLLSPAAKASTITFNFNTLANGAGDSSVQSYMNGVLTGIGGTVTVTGAQASNSYTGDGHVVGPTMNNGVKSDTLATLDGTFIDNVSSSAEIDMTFNNLKIYSVSFDYEIFPDGTCPTGNNCGSNWPDFTFKAGGNQIFETLAVMPGHPGAPYTHSPASGVNGVVKSNTLATLGGTFIDNVSTSSEIDMTFNNLKIYSVSFDYEIFPDGTCPTGNKCGSNWPDFTFKAGGNQIFETLAVMPGHPGALYTHSPASGVNGVELAPQFLGQSGTFSFPNGVSTLNFIDWPATIAIDNLVISKTPPTPIPEPCTLLLFATGLAGLSGLKRRARKA